jgi:hypothetical protein
MDDRELVALLEAIKSMALVPYPFPEGARVDPVLLMALGEIAGIAMKAVTEYRTTQ